MPWSSIRGHNAQIDAFRRVCHCGRLAHAYAFLGPRGVGKRTFAIALAKALVCETQRASALDACDQCPACVQVEAGMHPDVMLLRCPEDKQEFPIHLIQDLIRFLAMKPAKGGHKVAIVDDADLFNDEASNCALKTLEEPPPRSLLILLGSSAEAFLPTILSRCHIVHFLPLPREEVRSLLAKEGIQLAEADWAELLDAAQGSLERARLLLDESVRHFRQIWLNQWTQSRLDSVALAAQLVQFVSDAGKEGGQRRERARLIVGFMVDMLRTASRWRWLGVPVGQQNSPAGRLAERLSPACLERMLSRSLTTEHHLDRRLQLDLALEAWVDALAREMGTASHEGVAALL